MKSRSFDFNKFEEKWKKLFDNKANVVAKEYSELISQRAQKNFDRAKDNMSGSGKNIMVYSTKVDNKSYDIKAVGSQVVFMEFGTGVFNETYPIDYMYNLSLRYHGTFGQGKGKRRAWGFYGRPSEVAKGFDNFSNRHDFYVDPVSNRLSEEGDSTHHYYGDKRNIGDYATNKGVIITYGINPQRCLYNAIKDAKQIKGR